LDGLEPGSLRQFSLLELRQGTAPVTLQTGDTLQLKLTLTDVTLPNLPAPTNPGNSVSSRPSQTADGKSTEIIIVTIDIVAKPVIPVPEAAYGLLRRQTIGQSQQVECVRFAWNAQPSRIELICPGDLRSAIVRRRAVFQWTDAVRPTTTSEGYMVQKVTQTGATHFPGNA
jgi:hypothetical protein